MSHLDSFHFPSLPEILLFSRGATALALSLALSLAGCGGGGRGEGASAESKALVSSDTTAPDAAASGQARASSQPSRFLPASNAAPSAETIATQQDGARLNIEELAQIAKTGVLPKPFEGRSFSGASEKAGVDGAATKSATSRVPTYRFFNTRTSAHFFTTSETERANVQATLPFMRFEGPAFNASSTAIPGLSPVHRFYNTATGVHFYTISETERAHLAATLPQFNYEGVAYHASTLPGTGYTPLYRFFYASKGFHFYTNSAVEKDNIIATLPQYSFEGVGYYVLDGDWQTPAVPHTGITSAQCYAAGSSEMVTCTPSLKAINTGGSSVNLNPLQDGHRRNINPLSYSAVGSNPITSCVRDDVTGLVWEGKTPTGECATTKLYTNYGDGTNGDASAYVARINQLNHCGFTDWRLPTVEEFYGLAQYALGSSPKIDAAWFPGTSLTPYWTSEVPVSPAGFTLQFNFDSLVIQYASAAVTAPVRLVRGAPWSGTRRMIVGVAYNGDGANNAVIDRKTGLIWRRCLEGQAWSGSACSGTSGTYTHEGALIRAKAQSGWRLPNVKELGSLIDRSREAPAFDPGSFPSNTNAPAWSSTPYGFNPSNAWLTDFREGHALTLPRSDAIYGVRLVRSSP